MYSYMCAGLFAGAIGSIGTDTLYETTPYAFLHRTIDVHLLICSRVQLVTYYVYLYM